MSAGSQTPDMHCVDVVQELPFARLCAYAGRNPILASNAAPVARYTRDKTLRRPKGWLTCLQIKSKRSSMHRSYLALPTIESDNNIGPPRKSVEFSKFNESFVLNNPRRKSCHRKSAP